MAAQGIKLSEDDIYFIRYQYRHAKNQRQMLRVLTDLFLVSKARICEIVGAEPSKVNDRAAYKPEECDIILKFWAEGEKSVKERLEQAGFNRSLRAIHNKHLALVSKGGLSSNGKGLTWSDAEDRYIMANMDKPTGEIAAGLLAEFGTVRTAAAIRNRKGRIKEAL